MTIHKKEEWLILFPYFAASPTKVSVGLDNRLPEKSTPFDKTPQQEQEDMMSPTHSPSKGHGNNLDMVSHWKDFSPLWLTLFRFVGLLSLSLCVKALRFYSSHVAFLVRC